MSDPRERVPPSWPRFDPDVDAAVQAALRSGEWGVYRGNHVPKLEDDLAAFHDVPHAITCASGTLAVEIALRAFRVGPGDDVWIAAYEYESNFLTIHALGANPVLIDVSERNWNLGALPEPDGRVPKAILCSHLHGGLVPMLEVMTFAKKHGIRVVEDAAQATGATVQGRVAGTWGDIGTLSFGGSKLLTAGRGGALLSRDPQLFQRVKTALHRGIQPFAPLSELQAAALIPQLKKLPEMNRLRSEHVAMLKAAIAEEIPGLKPFQNAADAGDPAWYKVGFQYNAEAFGLSRVKFVRRMRMEGVAFDAGFAALHIGRSPSRFRAWGELGNATEAHDRCVLLHHPVLSDTDEALRQVIVALRNARNR